MNRIENLQLFTSNSFSKAWEFKKKLENIFRKNNYIEKNDYIYLVNKYDDTFKYLQRLKEDSLLKYACSINNIGYQTMIELINSYFMIDKVIYDRNYYLVVKNLNLQHQIQESNNYSYKGYLYSNIIEMIINCLIEISSKRLYGVSVLAYTLKGDTEKEYKTINI